MRKVAKFFLLFVFIFPSTAFAKVNVEISNNLDGSSNHVNVNSNTSSNTQSQNGVQNQTHITINNNGEKKEYNGSDGNIKLESDDGKSSVSVNTTGASNNSVHSSSSVNSKTNITVNSNTEASPSASPEPAVAGVSITSDQDSEKRSGFFDFIKKEISRLLELFN